MTGRHSPQGVLDKLPAELKAQQKNQTAVMRRLRAESASWMTSDDGLGAKYNVCDAFILHWWVHCLEMGAIRVDQCSPRGRRLERGHLLALRPAQAAWSQHGSG